MLNFKIYTLGCKVAQAEGYQVKLLLQRFGMRESSKGDIPDLCIVNSCAVTSAAGGKSRRLVYKLARSFPNTKIVLLGCYASLADQSFNHIPQVALIADHRRGILAAMEHFLLQSFSGKSDTPWFSASIQDDTTCNTDIKPSFTAQVKDNFNSQNHRQPRHRAFLKIQDGCNSACTYCIIPHLRPNLSSVPHDQVLEQARALIDAGHQEIVLCGIFLGAYGKQTTRKTRFDDPDEPLATLIADLIQISNLGRLRLSSLEPMDLTEKLVKVLASSEKVAGHLHLPLQSGSDNILRRMGRQYRSDDYLRAVEKARKAMPDIALTTDVIVGFPTESDEDFKNTLTGCKQSGFAKIHIFPSSPRPDTPAANWQNRMPDPAIVESRFDQLQELETTLARQFRAPFLHRNVRVLVEELEQVDKVWYCLGRADQYFRVRFAGKPEYDNKFYNVLINNVDQEPLLAVL